MEFDIAKTLQDVSGQVMGELGEVGSAFAGELGKAFAEKQQSIAELSSAFLSGEIDEAELKQELAREQKVIEAQLITLEIAATAAIQKAVNGVVDGLVSTLKGAL
ncbi:hypothetical protein [Pseudoalteromonas luteoviolacea]|uniref:Uncharacterized protein n=1 Tax=Pseudoalteromonas luteoviolacea NCIMB 1942 TaxID=1365253 RepID=A0A167BWG9_9GAMM|nr:hypothetical protein [Pseudoalteromonas luteoviolacea]KZN46979.1 hypothetical protein N482_11235 [Pseudoalteromonas luteoviolacea NCIMB 1942]KZX00195.1 hypothetical protein JL49_13140 [Pseudoalteromonas luteoviolacea]